MADRIIDLRKKTEPRSLEVLHQDSRDAKVLRNGTQGKEILSWEAPEFKQASHNPYWWMWVGVAALILVVWGIFARSYFFIALVVVAYVVLILYSRKKPRVLKFSIYKNGLRAGRTFYPFSEFKSFWIFEGDEGRELSFETSRRLSPFIRISLDKAPVDEVLSFLRRVLPEKEHPELFLDQLAKKI